MSRSRVLPPREGARLAGVGAGRAAREGGGGAPLASESARQTVRLAFQRGDRAGLLATHRPVIADLLHSLSPTVPPSTTVESLCAYVVTLTEPTGYLIAVGLAQRCGGLDPDPVLHAALSAGARAPILIGAVAQAVLVALLAALAPATQQLAGALEAASAPNAPPEQPGASALRVIVAAGGGAELFLLRR